MQLRLTAVLAALMLLLSGCGALGLQRKEKTRAQSTLKVTYGSRVKDPPTLDTRGTGTIVLSVSDDKGRALAGAIITYKGPRKKGTLVTNARGVARGNLPPGPYGFDVAPCGTTIITTSTAPAGANIVRGTTLQAVMTGVTWEHRFRPSPSVTFTPPAPWKLDQRVDVGILVEDRCRFAPAPRARIASYGWRLSKNFRALERPVMRADQKGIAHLVMTCVGRGGGEVVIYDSVYRDDKIDVLLAGTAPPDGRDWCE